MIISRLLAGTAIIVATFAASYAVAQSVPVVGGTPPEAQPSNGVTQSAFAEDPDIIVTATRRETTLQKTPIAVSAFSQATLDRQQVRDVTDLARFVPSLQFTQQGDQSAVLLTLRGIGNDSAYTEVADPEVAIYIDGVYSSRSQGASVLFYDLERAEVLRGPQGTLFGRNATVGALSLITAKPKFDSASGYVEAIAGDYSRFGSRGAVNLPVNDKLALRFAFVTERNDGYADFQPAPNIKGIDASAYVTAGKKYYARDQASVRGSLLFKPTDRLTWNLSAEYFLDKGAPVIGLLQTPRPGTKFWSTLSDTAPDTDRYSLAIRSDINYDISDGLRAEYIAGFTRIGGSTQTDADAGALPPTGGVDPASGKLLYLGGFGQNATVYSKYDFSSHEFQLKSQGQHTIDFIGGVYYAHEVNKIRFDVDQRDGYRDGSTRAFVGSFIQADREIDSLAGFGQATWNVNSRLRLTGGLRYTHDTKKDVGGRNVTAFGCPTSGPCNINIFGQFPNATADQLVALLNAQGGAFSISNNDVKGSWNKLSYLGRIDADLADNVLGYASISTGFKSGNIQDGGRTTNPENITNYEVGLKSRLFDRRLTLNVAGYYSDFTGYQVNQVLTTRDAAGNTIASQIITQNAKGATAYGFEAEAVANVTENDRIQVSATVQKTKLKTLVTADGRFDDQGAVSSLRDLAGNELAHAPRFSATATYEHDFKLTNGGSFTPRATVHYETRSWLSFFDGDRTNRVVNGVPVYYGSDFDKQKAYSRTDLALRYNAPADKYLLELFVQNVEDGKIRTNASTFGPTQYAPVFLSNYQAPRTFGGRVRLNF
ncbi:TonB-dependent receptor [Glacieibacterium megasporae]|uniref:TonB-dependent receptor n=1 Tax=Glacieibacterium megasporae TaxID=2835787 RepID=UPI001C1E404F|nr:TonB-dependent receptor [Polymorphobacter megasporae]UAJ10979.1 TonB-dependent receptor [Polymorphobacter megasporae]